MPRSRRPACSLTAAPYNVVRDQEKRFGGTDETVCSPPPAMASCAAVTALTAGISDYSVTAIAIQEARRAAHRAYGRRTAERIAFYTWDLYQAP